MEKIKRRQFLGSIIKPAASASVLAALNPIGMKRAMAIAKEKNGKHGKTGAIAEDESFWFEVQQAYTADRSLINLNKGGVSPAPAVVQDAMKRYLDYSNTAH